MKYVAVGYVDKSKGIDAGEKVVKATGLAATINAKVSGILEMIDYYKDWIYLFMFKHRLMPFLFLAFSLSFPFAVFDA